MRDATTDARADAAGERRLGELRVHRLGFGAMRLTGKGVWGPPEDREAAVRVLRRARALGVNFIDTADSYGPEVSEELIADALHPYSPELVIATKGGYERGGPGSWTSNGRPQHLRRACEGSLRRLRLEAIDLYQLHTPDPDVPYAESVGALADLRSEGKIRFVGVSNVNREQLETAREVVEVVSVQNRYNLLERDDDQLLDHCEAEGLGFIPYFPLGAGSLLDDESVVRVARRLDATSAQVALAWLLHRSPATLPIPGTSSLEHLEEDVGAASLELDEEAVRTLEERSSGG